MTAPGGGIFLGQAEKVTSGRASNERSRRLREVLQSQKRPLYIFLYLGIIRESYVQCGAHIVPK